MYLQTRYPAHTRLNSIDTYDLEAHITIVPTQNYIYILNSQGGKKAIVKREGKLKVAAKK